MASAVFPKVTVFSFLDDPSGNYSKKSVKVQFNPDGTFSAESSAEDSSTEASFPTYDIRRHDSGTYAVMSGGSTLTLQFVSCQVYENTCFGPCSCGKCDTNDAMRPWTPPQSTIDCTLPDGKLTGFPGVIGGYSLGFWHSWDLALQE